MKFLAAAALFLASLAPADFDKYSSGWVYRQTIVKRHKYIRCSSDIVEAEVSNVFTIRSSDTYAYYYLNSDASPFAIEDLRDGSMVYLDRNGNLDSIGSQIVELCSLAEKRKR